MKTRAFFKNKFFVAGFITVLMLVLFGCNNSNNWIPPAEFKAAMIISNDAPWGDDGALPIYQDGMNQVFGTGEWDQLDLYTEDGSAFATDSPYDFIYLEGSCGDTPMLVTYLLAHLTDIETWVRNGGRLYINAAACSGDAVSVVNAPFGVSIEYDYFTDDANAVDPAHPVFNGPFTPTGTTFTGVSFGHSRVIGAGLTNIIVEQTDATLFCLASAVQGSGFIVYGGITSDYFHDPQPNAHNLFKNILAFASDYGREGIALFTNTTYVDYRPGETGAEASNLEETVQDYGIDVSTFTGIASTNFTTAADNRKALLIPEIERDNLNAALDDAARTAIADFVDAGGNLIIFYPAANGELQLLNDAFGWSLAYGSDTINATLNAADAAGTPFESGPGTLPGNDATCSVDITSLPAGAKTIYTDDDSGDAAVVVIPHGDGNVIIIGWDWYDAAPLGSQNGGWLDVLETAINL